MKESLSSSNSAPLYVCATPIGNLDDVSLRLRETLMGVEVVAAEDTRRSQILLKHLGLSKPSISLQKHNEASRVETLKGLLSEGKSVALLSDAGTPNICDPGAYLIQALAREGYRIVPISGPCAVSTLLSVSGVLANQYVFGGFFPKKRGEVLSTLVLADGKPLVFFEAPARILETVQWLQSNLEVHEMVIAKELTKAFECIWYSAESFLSADFSQLLLKGEWCFLVKGTYLHSKKDPVRLVESLKSKGLTWKQVLYVGKEVLGLARNDLYEAFHHD